MKDTHTEFEDEAIVLAKTDWHIYEELGSEESEEKCRMERPKVGYLYNYEPRTNHHFSVLRMSDMFALMARLGRGEMMEFGRFVHFDDRQIEHVKEILCFDYVHWDGCFISDPFFVAFVHLVEFRNNEIAEAIALELLKRGHDIRSAGKAFLEGYFECDHEDEVNEFVIRCEKIHLHSNLHATLKLNIGSTNLGSKKI